MLNSDAWYDAAELVVGVLLQYVPLDLAKLRAGSGESTSATKSPFPFPYEPSASS